MFESLFGVSFADIMSGKNEPSRNYALEQQQKAIDKEVNKILGKVGDKVLKERKLKSNAMKKEK